MDKSSKNRRSNRYSVKRQTIVHQQELDDHLQSNQQKANMLKGLEYREKMMLRDENKQPYPLCVETKEFGKFGVGLQLFFEFIKFSAIAFFIMALISIPALVSNIEADGLSDNYTSEASTYSILTLANQPELMLVSATADATNEDIKEIQNENEQIMEAWVQRMKDRMYWVVAPDVIYSIFFFLFILYWRYRSKQIKKQSIIEEAVPSHYALYVYGFDSELKDEQIIRDLFSKFGHIQEAKLVRNYYGTLSLHQQEANILHKISIEEQRLKIKNQSYSKTLEKLEKKLDKVESDISKIIEKKLGSIISHNKYPSLGAYIVFNSIEDKLNCKEIFRRAHQWCGHKDKRCFYKGKLLKVKNCDEPSNIKWENLDATTGERCWRLTVVVIAVLAVMILTFSIIFVANIVKPNTSTSCSSVSYTLEEAQAADDDDVTACYCQENWTKIPNDNDIKNFCWDYYIQYVSMTIISIATALIIIIVNFLLNILLKALGKFSKYKTITKETIGITLSLFAAMFVNTAIITLLLQADIFGWVPVVTATAPIPPLQNLQQENESEFSADFDRPWYISVGAKIILTMMVSVFSPHLTFWLLLPCYRRQRQKKANKAIIQKDLNQNMTGPQFQVTAYYASVLNVMFVTLFYSSGIPILLFFASITMTIQYWVYKYYVLRDKKRPPQYDPQLNAKIIDILPFAIFLHLIIGIYMYGSPLFFPGSTDAVTYYLDSNDENTAIKVTEYDKFSYIKERITNQWLMLTALCAMVLFYILDKTLITMLQSLYRCLCCGKKEEDDDHLVHPRTKNTKELQKANKQFGTYQEEYPSMSRRMISSYDIRLNEEYSLLIKAIEVGKEDIEKKSEANSPANSSKLEKLIKKNQVQPSHFADMVVHEQDTTPLAQQIYSRQ